MSESLKLRGECSLCQGSGLADSKDENGNPIKVPCQSCGQTGKFVIGEVDGAETLDKIVRKLNKILKKLEISDEE
jgi:excinuclease UvrABC ATPase subunit